MTPIAAKLTASEITPRQVAAETVRIAPPRAVSPVSAPVGMIASVAIHALIALALVALPMQTGVIPELDTSWVSFDLEVAPPAPVVPEPEVTPEIPEPAPMPLPERVVHRERPQPTPPQPVATPEPEIHAPPSLDEAFAEPPPPAAIMTASGTGGFAMQQGELGGVVGGVPGGHGTSLVSARPSAAPATSTLEADRRRARRGYVHAIEELVRAHTRYPRAASREGLQGRVELALRIGDDGRVLAVRVASTSGHGILDDAALDAAREIARMPAPPLVAALTPTDEVRIGVVYVVR